MNGATLFVDKPVGLTSFGVVARIRRVLTHEKRVLHNADPQSCPNYRQDACRCKVKIGHTGTLDPFATGLMIVVVGKETKNAASYSKLDKVYEATIRLGATSSTGDPEGDIHVMGRSSVVTRDEIETALCSLVGEIQQTPPVYSAIKIDGQRAYKLARKGQDIQMPQRTVTIHSIDLLDYDYPDLCIRVHVSSGTYIRTFAEDIGKKLGVGAYCLKLRRTRISHWSVDDAETLEVFLRRYQDGDSNTHNNHQNN